MFLFAWYQSSSSSVYANTHIMMPRMHITATIIYIQRLVDKYTSSCPRQGRHKNSVIVSNGSNTNSMVSTLVMASNFKVPLLGDFT